jgi:hypothetical protein
VEVHDERMRRIRCCRMLIDSHKVHVVRASDRLVFGMTFTTHSAKIKFDAQIVIEAEAQVLQHVRLKHLRHRRSGDHPKDGADTPGSNVRGVEGSLIKLSK